MRISKSMQMKVLPVSLCICMLFTKSVYAQEVVQVTNEKIILNSTFLPSNDTRHVTKIIFPDNTKEYIYRISVWQNGSYFTLTPLFATVQQIVAGKVKLSDSIPEIVIRDANNDSVDVFIFTTVTDADIFLNKQDTFKICKRMPDSKSSCTVTHECLEKEIYFGFSNNNKNYGLDIKLEIVAVVNTL